MAEGNSWLCPKAWLNERRRRRVATRCHEDRWASAGPNSGLKRRSCGYANSRPGRDHRSPQAADATLLWREGSHEMVPCETELSDAKEFMSGRSAFHQNPGKRGSRSSRRNAGAVESESPIPRSTRTKALSRVMGNMSSLESERTCRECLSACAAIARPLTHEGPTASRFLAGVLFQPTLPEGHSIAAVALDRCGFCMIAFRFGQLACAIFQSVRDHLRW